MTGLLLAVLLATTPKPTPAGKPDVAQGLRVERERLASYRWRLKTEMKVDGDLRLSKLEDVHLADDGSFARTTVKYDKKPPAPPLPDRDPRRAYGPPPTPEEEDRLSDQAQELMQLYVRITPERLAIWAMGAQLLGEDPDRPGQVRMQGRSLLRPLDDAVLYLDAKTRKPREIEVKTTVDPKERDIAFMRATFEELPVARADVPPLVVPKQIFLNMTRGRRRVTLEMELTDFRLWS